MVIFLVIATEFIFCYGTNFKNLFPIALDKCQELSACRFLILLNVSAVMPRTEAIYCNGT